MDKLKIYKTDKYILETNSKQEYETEQELLNALNGYDLSKYETTVEGELWSLILKHEMKRGN